MHRDPVFKEILALEREETAIREWRVQNEGAFYFRQQYANGAATDITRIQAEIAELKKHPAVQAKMAEEAQLEMARKLAHSLGGHFASWFFRIERVWVK